MAYKKPIRYLGIAWETIDKEVKKVEWRTIKRGQAHVKTYQDAFKIIFKIKQISQRLIYFLAETMDKKSIVYNNKETKRNFNKYYETNYSDNSINRSFSELVEVKFLIRIPKGKRGLHKVNPVYFFKGDDNQRIDSIRYDLEQRCRPVVNRYRAETYNADMALKEFKRKQKEKNNES